MLWLILAGLAIVVFTGAADDARGYTIDETCTVVTMTDGRAAMADMYDWMQKQNIGTPAGSVEETTQRMISYFQSFPECSDATVRILRIQGEDRTLEGWAQELWDQLAEMFGASPTNGRPLGAVFVTGAQ